VLALIAASFTEGRERTRALSVYTAVAMGGGSLGLVLGGVITEWVSWRWVLFVNVPIGIAVSLAAPRFLPESGRQPGRFDVAGALTSTAGMASLAYGFIRAGSNGWADRQSLGAFAVAVVALALFAIVESRASQPITPLRLFADRGRTGSYITRLLLVAGMFGMFFFLTQFVQTILGFSPLRAGISFLPMTVALFAVSRLSARLVARYRLVPLMVTGMLPVVAGMTWLSRISPGTGYLSGVLGPMLLLGAGMGVVFVPLTMASLAGVRPEESGAASSMVNVTQQVGGSLGLAALVTAFATASRNTARGAAGHLAPLAQAHQATVHGTAVAFRLAAVFDVAALLIVATVIRVRAARPAATAQQRVTSGSPRP
jgi:predicted MFS family arabinose efflux permease